jgi:hypothetical protein
VQDNSHPSIIAFFEYKTLIDEDVTVIAAYEMNVTLHDG